jgi:Phycobilisome protein
MLSQTRQLLQTSQGRYATDAELAFFESYAQSYRLRLQTYRKLQSLEREIIVQVFRRLKANNPQVFQRGSQDITQKWQRDTIWVLRFSALAMLFDDTDILRDRLLLWFQTIMRAFSLLQVTRMTYEAMQVVVRQLFEPQEAELLCTVLEVNRETFDLPDP